MLRPAISAKSFEEVVSEYIHVRGRSTETIRTNFGLYAGAYHPYDVIVCPTFSLK